MIDLRTCRLDGPLTDKGFYPIRGPREALEQLMLLPGARWNKTQRKWYIPANALPLLSSDETAYYADVTEYADMSKLPLRPYQLETLARMERTPLGFLVGLDVGTGKTPVACAYLAKHKLLRPFIVVGPAIATGTWTSDDADPARYFGLKIVALEGIKLAEAAKQLVEYRDVSKPGAWFVDGFYLNYNILPKWLPFFMTVCYPAAVVLDEAQELTNPRTLHTKAVKKICRQPSVCYRIAMTATPVNNNVADLWAILDILQPDCWGAYVPYNPGIPTSFAGRYASASHNGYGWTLGGEAQTQELSARLSSCYFAKTRDELRKGGQGLGKLVRQAVDVPVSELDRDAYAEYRAAATDETGATLWDAAVAPELQRCTKMASSLSWAKRHAAITQAKMLCASAPEHKLVVFTWFKETGAFIADALEAAGYVVFAVNGETPTKKRIKLAEVFRDYHFDGAVEGAHITPGVVFVATMRSAGVSLNPLSAAAVGLCVDFYWVPNRLIQMEGRLDRCGQRAKSVLFVYLRVKNSMDTIMYHKLEKKAHATASTVGDAAGVSLCEVLGGSDEKEAVKSLLDELRGLAVEDMELR